MTTTYETQARAAKAAALIAWFRARNVTSKQIAEDVSWRDLAVAETGVNEPSLTTWQQVVSIVAMLERTTPVDPFAGL